MSEINHELVTALKLAKTKAMQFALVAKGPTDGTLLVSKNKIQAKAIAEAKKTLGGGQIYKGRCLGDADGELVFEIAKDPPASLSKTIKTIIHRDAGLTLKVDARKAHDVSDEDDQEETDTEEAAAPADQADANAGAPAKSPGNTAGAPSADKDQVHNRLAAIAVKYKKAVAAGGADAGKLHTLFEAIKAFVEKHDYVHASQGLDQMEKLLGSSGVSKGPQVKLQGLNDEDDTPDSIAQQGGQKAATSKFANPGQVSADTVQNKVVRGLYIHPKVVFLPVGVKQTYIATRVYSDKTTLDLQQQVEWTSSDPDIISIGLHTGEATAKLSKEGPVTLTAKDTEFGSSKSVKIVTQREHTLPLPAGMPKGKLTYFVDEEPIVMPQAQNVVKSYLEAKSLHESLDKMMARINQFAGQVKSTDEVVRDVQTNTDKDSKVDAKLATLASQDVSLIDATYGLLQQNMQSAVKNMQFDQKELDSATKKEDAAAFRKKGQELEKEINFAIKTISNAMKITTAIATDKWDTAIASGVDEIGEVIKAFYTNNYLQKASSLEEEARTLDLNNAQDKLAQAKIDLTNANAQVEKAKPLVEKFQETYTQFSKEAEQGFDTKSKGTFRFNNAKQALGQAKEAEGTASDAAKAAQLALMDAKTLGRHEGWTPPFPGEISALEAALATDSQNWRDQAMKQQKEIKTLMVSLDKTYKAAQIAMVKASGKGKK
jgi:hypothetical protein